MRLGVSRGYCDTAMQLDTKMVFAYMCIFFLSLLSLFDVLNGVVLDSLVCACFVAWMGDLDFVWMWIMTGDQGKGREMSR